MKHNLTLNATEFMIDFEVAAMQSIKIFFHHAGKEWKIFLIFYNSIHFL